jgi:hypothetical protein
MRTRPATGGRVFDSYGAERTVSEHGSRVRRLCATPVSGGPGANGLALGDLPGVEQVELDFPHDVGDAGLAGLASGEVAGLLGFPRAGPVGGGRGRRSRA